MQRLPDGENLYPCYANDALQRKPKSCRGCPTAKTYIHVMQMPLYSENLNHEEVARRRKPKPMFMQNKVSPNETKSNKSCQMRPNQIKSHQMRPNQIKPRQMRLNQTKSRQMRPNQIKSHQMRLNQIKPRQMRLNQTMPRQMRQNQIKPI